MITIPEVVEQIVVSSPFFEEGLSKKIINCSALARQLRPAIEKRLFRKVQNGAILMALRRLSRKMKHISGFNTVLSSHNDLIVRSNLVEFVMNNTDFLIDMHKYLINLAEQEEQYFMTITEGIFETTIIASNELYSQIKKVLAEGQIITELKDLSSITIRLPKENIYMPGLYYHFLKALAWKRINIVEVVSTYTEITLVLDNKEVDRAFSVLKRSIASEVI